MTTPNGVQTRYRSGGYSPGERYLDLRPLEVGPHRPLLLLHGADGDELLSALAVPNMARVAREAAAAGFHVMQPDMRVLTTDTGAHTWGVDGSTTTLDNAATYLQGTLGAASGDVAILCMSMGLVTAMNYVRRFPGRVSALVAISGAADLDWMHQSGGFATQINTAYGGTFDPGGATSASHNPLEFAAALPSPPPFRAYHDMAGDAVAPGAHVETLAGLVGGTVVDVGTGGHTDALWAALDVADVVAFLRSHP